MPNPQSWYAENVQPVNWHRAIISGMLGSLIMMSFVDTFYMMGVTPFCFETYLGSLLLMELYQTKVWIVGFFANLVMGGVFGLLYGFVLEDVFKRSGARNGIFLGFYHAIVAAVAVFPFFKLVEDASRVEMYPNFGFFGSGLGAATPLILFFGHLLFGACVGTFYGPVRMARMRARFEEPEDTVYEEELIEETGAEDQGKAA